MQLRDELTQSIYRNKSSTNSALVKFLITYYVHTDLSRTNFHWTLTVNRICFNSLRMKWSGNYFINWILKHTSIWQRRSIKRFSKKNFLLNKKCNWQIGKGMCAPGCQEGDINFRRIWFNLKLMKEDLCCIRASISYYYSPFTACYTNPFQFFFLFISLISNDVIAAAVTLMIMMMIDLTRWKSEREERNELAGQMINTLLPKIPMAYCCYTNLLNDWIWIWVCILLANIVNGKKWKCSFPYVFCQLCLYFYATCKFMIFSISLHQIEMLAFKWRE